MSSYSLEELQDGKKRVVESKSETTKAPTVAYLQRKKSILLEELQKVDEQIGIIAPLEEEAKTHNESIRL